jgi:uncharacterized protein
LAELTATLEYMFYLDESKPSPPSTRDDGRRPHPTCSRRWDMRHFREVRAATDDGSNTLTSKEVRDAVHGLVELDKREWQVVDSPAFQRLRGIQQLAATHLVYPGARHSRFEHCIGACHVAGRLADRLGLSRKELARVRAAALVHDIGHGPFSHVSEFVFEDLTGQDHVHEKISAAVVRHHEPIRSALESDAEWVADLLSGTGHGAKRSAARDIIAGPADIDKLDYLLRDSHYCGVEYGKYDIDKVIESARLVKRPDGQYLAYHRDGVFAIEAMLLARYHMHRQVYGHKTRLATDKMLVRAMHLGVEEELLPRNVFAPVELDATFVNEYLDWDDHRTLKALSDAEGSKASLMARALSSRRLMKRVTKLTIEDLISKSCDRMLAGEAISPKQDVLRVEQPNAEKLVADAAGVDPMWVVLHWEELQNPITSRDDFRITDKEVLITDDEAKTVEKFTELSEVFNADTGARARRSVSVFIRPPDGSDGFTAGQTRIIRKASIKALQQVGEAGQAV